MRKTILASALGLTAGLAAPVQQDGDLASRVDAMATELATTRTEFAVAQSRLDQVESYLQAQAKAAAATSTALQESEDAGFTMGINGKSREILLAAWRAETASAAAGVPGAEVEVQKKR